MIAVKLLTTAKGSTATKGTAAGATTATTATEALHAVSADRADRATLADRATTADRATEATHAQQADSARTARHATTAAELDSGALALRGLAHKDREETFEKEVTFQDVVTYLREVVFRGNASFQSLTAQGTASVQDLTVWGKALFHELEIRRLSYAGGNVYLSGAGSKIARVEELDDRYRCYLLADDGTTATENLWQPRDQARCQTFNISPGTHQGAANRQYWRVVTQVGTETVQLYEGQPVRFAYIDLAKDNCLEGSDAPQQGDTIVLDGCQDPQKPDRQGVLTLESTGTGAPRIVAYKGVSSYSHEGREVFRLSPEGSRIVSTSLEWISGTGETMHLVNYRGEWQEGTQYGYYDQVNHLNALYTCTNTGGTTQEPSPTCSDWTLVLCGEKGDQGEDALSVQIVSDRGNVILNGEGSRTLTAHVYRGSDEITDQLPPTAFSWRRTSQDAADDQVWNRRHEGVGCQIVVGKEDILRSALFTCEAYIG